VGAIDAARRDTSDSAVKVATAIYSIIVVQGGPTGRT